jgi:hypothetical protein
MIIISGTRNINIGDTEMYFGIFSDTVKYGFNFTLDNAEALEPGYLFLNYLMGLFTDDARVFIFFMSFITLTGFAFFIYKNSYNIWLSTFIFVAILYPESLNIIRQAFATMLLANGYYFLKNNKFKKYLLVVFVAYCFHFTAALFFIIMIFLPHMSNRKLVLLSALIIVGYYYTDSLVDLLFSLPFIGKYSGYATSIYALSLETGGLGFYKQFLFWIIVFISCMNYKNYTFFEKREHLYLSTFIVFGCMFLLYQYHFIILGRFYYYFIVYLCLLIPLLIKNSSKYKKLIYYAGTFVMSIVYLYSYLVTRPDLFVNIF